jgi:DNA-binding MarR family transcriptional regulator
MAKKRDHGGADVLLNRQAYASLLRTADCVRGLTAKTVEPDGITGQQYNVLRILGGAEPEGLQTLALADRMIERAPGVTRMIDRLEAKGLAVRERRKKDRRCVHCRITSRGLELLRKLDQPVDQTNKEAFAPLNAQEREQLVHLLERIRMRHQGK